MRSLALDFLSAPMTWAGLWLRLMLPCQTSRLTRPKLKGLAMTREEILKTLQELSKRTGFSIVEIIYLARMMAQAEYDPLPPEEWGEPFEFPQRRISVIGDEWDFDCIHAEVPKPD